MTIALGCFSVSQTYAKIKNVHTLKVKFETYFLWKLTKIDKLRSDSKGMMILNNRIVLFVIFCSGFKLINTNCLRMLTYINTVFTICPFL